MKKRLCIILFSVLFILFVPAGVQGQVFSDDALKFSQIINWIDKYYVDTINKSELVEKAIIEMLQNLDPHSTYMTREEVKAMSEPLQGNFEGIGISFNILNDTIFVINPIPNGPSEKVGIRSGDRIVKIEGLSVAGVGIKTSDVFSKLRGKKGTQVSVSISRRSVSELLDFTITRDKIPIYSLDASYMINDKIGYIKLNRFSHTTMNEFETALSELKGEGMQDLVLDLAGNGGGYMDVAIKLADQFLNDRKIIVYTEGHSHPKRKFYSSSRGDFLDGRIVIIIDQGSASASEIVAGAVQDWDRGVIVGRRSFGKGLVQNPMLLLDSSMVRLTIARYFTPTGRLIQKPYEDGFEEYSKDLINRYNMGELLHSDSIVFPESLKYQTLVSQRPVYGGGGIMPDNFVPLDTTYNSRYYSRLLGRGIINFFTLSYVDDHREELQAKYPTFQSFLDGFTINSEILEDLIAYASDQDLDYNKEDYDVSREHIRLVLKAYIARDLWNSSEFYEVFNTSNPSVLKAIEVLDGQDVYQDLLGSKQ
jgi:carboxyl-terminal processing protease